MFCNTRKGLHLRQYQPSNKSDIIHMFGKFTFIKVDDVETIVIIYF